MKKTGLALLLAMALVGCSEETGKQETKPTEQKPATEEKVEDVVSVEVTEKVFYKWNDDSIGGMEQISSYAVIENNGKEPVDVGNTSLTYLDSSGGVIGVTEANSIYQNIYPSIIAPGGVAYMAIKDDGGDMFKDLKDIEVKVNPIETPVKVEELKTDKVNVQKNDYLSVTGFISAEKQADSIHLAAGLYDADDKFVGAVLPGSDQSWMLAEGEKSSFDLSVPTFPSNQVENVESVKVIGTSIEIE